MNLTAREWFQVIALAAFLWAVIGCVAFGLITLAAAIAP